MVLKILGELTLVGAIASVFIFAAQGWAEERAAEEASGKAYMRTLDELTSKMKNRKVIASWNYETNITKFNEDQMVSTFYYIMLHSNGPQMDNIRFT